MCAAHRYHVGMQQEEALMAVRGRAMLILDTTYCAAQYDFPPQLQVLTPVPACLGSTRMLHAVH